MKLPLFRILASDDVQVAQVRIEISDEIDTVQETGQTVLILSQLLEYTLEQALSGDLTVTFSASDVPGHVAKVSASKRLPG
jgi:hypothetical protein